MGPCICAAVLCLVGVLLRPAGHNHNLMIACQFADLFQNWLNREIMPLFGKEFLPVRFALATNVMQAMAHIRQRSIHIYNNDWLLFRHQSPAGSTAERPACPAS